MASATLTNSPRGIPLSKVSPAFLHANSTSHTWAFSAVAELIDNAYDPDVSASELLIDKLEINGHSCVIFLDNGAGMDTDHLLKMLSFGFCEKEMYEVSTHLPIGRYGNGFKSGSMRLAQDALVFTRCQTSASIGFLSQTYLKAIGADSVFIPILKYRLPKLDRIKSEQSRNNLNAILMHSVYNDEQDLKDELRALEGSKTGTKIILSNLKRLQDGTLELDFSSDVTDIRCPEAHETDLTSVYHRPVQLATSEYKHSLKEYCSMLFLRPRMKITIRGKKVKSKLICKSLSNTEIDTYKPSWLIQPLKITFGFTCDSEDYGMMLYHHNRLIKAFQKVGYQKQPNDLGVGVVGVAQVDFLTPTHNKQDFNKDEKFNSVMMAFAAKLNDYWNEKRNNPQTSFTNHVIAPDWTWAQCDQCRKWRRLPDGIDKDKLPDHWFCRLNPDATHNRCEIPEEPEDEDLAVKPSYVKRIKKQKEEMKRQEIADRNRQDVERRMLREKAVFETQRMEEEHRKMILKMESEKRQIEEQKKTLFLLAQSLKNSKGKNTTLMDKVTQFVGSIGFEIDVPKMNMNTQKRKMGNNVIDSPRTPKRPHVKEELSGTPHISKTGNSHPSYQPMDLSQKYTNASKRNGVSPLKVKVDGLFSPNINKRDQAVTAATAVALNSSFKAAVPPTPTSSSSSPSTSSLSSSAKKGKESTTQEVEVVDLTEDLDYVITMNEDYESDEDVKPDLNKLNSTLQGDTRYPMEKDVKPDKATLDRGQKSVNAGEPTVSTKSTDVSEHPVNIKKEILENEMTPSKKAVTPGTSSITNGPSCDPDGDEEMPESDTLSTNMDTVLAAIENKFKESQSKSKHNVTNAGDNDEHANSLEKDSLAESANKHTEIEQNEATTVVANAKADCEESRDMSVAPPEAKDDEDIVEIYSDDDDDLNTDVVIKKEFIDTEEVKGDDRNVEVEMSASGEDRQSNLEDKKILDSNNIEKTNDVDIEMGDPSVLESQGEEGRGDAERQSHTESAKYSERKQDESGGVENVEHCGDSDKGRDRSESGDMEVNSTADISNKNTSNNRCTPSEDFSGNTENNHTNEEGTVTDAKSTVDNNESIEQDDFGVEDKFDEDNDYENEDMEKIQTKSIENNEENFPKNREFLTNKDENEKSQDIKSRENSTESKDTQEEFNCKQQGSIDKESKREDGGDILLQNNIPVSNSCNVDKIKGASLGDEDKEVGSKANCSPVCSSDSIPCENQRKSDGAVHNISSSSYHNLCDRECQTDPIIKPCENEGDKIVLDEEYVENLRTKLQVKTQLLEENEERLLSLLVDVHQLLSFLSPDTDLGSVQDTEKTVKAMIQVHLESSQAVSQNKD